MVLILEGPDGAGKSMLAKKLEAQTGYKLICKSYPRTEEEKTLMVGTYLQDLKSAKNIIFDRAWYSDMVYGPVMRGETPITYPIMYELERKVAQQGGILIYCTAPWQELWRRCQLRGEEYIKDEAIFKRICEEYNRLMHVPHHVPVVKYVYDDL